MSRFRLNSYQFKGAVLLLCASLIFFCSRLLYINSGLLLAEPDEAYYHSGSQSIAQYWIPRVYGEPMLIHSALFEYLGYGLNLITHDSTYPRSFVSTRLVSVLSGLVLMLVLFFYTKRKQGILPAVYSLLFMLFLPIIVFYSKVGLRDMLFSLFVFCFFICFEHLVKKPNLRHAAVTGLLLGLSILAKSTGLVLLAIPVVFTIASNVRVLLTKPVLTKLYKSLKKQKRLIVYQCVSVTTALSIVFCIFIVPAYFTNKTVLHYKFLNMLFIPGKTTLAEKTADIVHYFANAEYWFSFGFILCVFVGIVTSRTKQKESYFIIHLFSLTLCLYLLTNLYAARYVLILTPFLFLYATLGLSQLVKVVSKIGSPTFIQIAVPTVIILAMIPHAKSALDSTNHQTLEKAFQLVREQRSPEPDQELLYSSFWPTVINYVSAIPTIRLTTYYEDYITDYNESPTVIPLLVESSFTGSDFLEPGQFSLIINPTNTREPPYRVEAVKNAAAHLNRVFYAVDAQPVFPEQNFRYEISVYKK